MILDEKAIQRWVREGRKLIAANGQPIPIKLTKQEEEKAELSHLKLIAALLAKLVAKPNPEPPKLEIPTVNIPPPQITVKPPEVFVSAPDIPPPPPRIRKWKFYIERDYSGHATEITATAIE